MTTIETLLLIGSIVVPSVIGLVALYYARKSAKLAEEQAERRPKLVVSMRDSAFTWGRGQVEHADAVLHFEITNTGKITAHNVGFDLQLEEPRLVDLLYGHPSYYQIGGVGDLLPIQEAPYPISLDVRVNAGGRARARYRCWCDEVPPIEEDIEFEVPPKESAPAWLAYTKEEPAPDFAIHKTWDSTPRVGESMSLHINATNQGGTALNVDLWDELPSNMWYVSHMGTDVGGGTPRECPHVSDPPGTMAGNAICRYDIVGPGESVTMEVNLTPTEAGTFTNAVYVQYHANPPDRGSHRVSEAFEVEALPENNL